MRKKVGVSGGPVANACWNLPVLALAGFGIAIAVSWSRKWLKNGDSLEGDDVDDGDTEGDKISQLPDDILSNIISCLVEVEAVRTSILSKRWKYIWMQRSMFRFPCLYLFEHGPGPNYNPCTQKYDYHTKGFCKEKHRFLKAVDQCLRLYSGRKLRSLQMDCCFWNEYSSDFARLMHSVARLGVERLYLTFACQYCNYDYMFTFSFKILSEASSLKWLMLSACHLRPNFVGQFNSLESLTLNRILLLRGELSSILSSCANLQLLSMSNCRFPSQLCISGKDLRLKFLKVLHPCGLQDLDVSAANLFALEFRSMNRIKILLSDVPKLTDLTVSLDGKSTVPYFFGELPDNLPELDSLYFHTISDEVLFLPLKSKSFGNLRQLQLLMVLKAQVDLRNIGSIVSACPLLNIFLLKASFSFPRQEMWVEWPPMRHTRLILMEFSGFRHTANEYDFVIYLLRSAAALVELKIMSEPRTYTSGYKWERVWSDPRNYRRNKRVEALQRHAISRCARVYMC